MAMSSTRKVVLIFLGIVLGLALLVVVVGGRPDCRGSW